MRSLPCRAARPGVSRPAPGERPGRPRRRRGWPWAGAGGAGCRAVVGAGGRPQRERQDDQTADGDDGQRQVPAAGHAGRRGARSGGGGGGAGVFGASGAPGAPGAWGAAGSPGGGARSAAGGRRAAPGRAAAGAGRAGATASAAAAGPAAPAGAKASPAGGTEASRPSGPSVSPSRTAEASPARRHDGVGGRGRCGGLRGAGRPGLHIVAGAPAEDRLGEGEAQAVAEPGELAGGPAAVTASGQVLPQIRVHAGAAAPEGHVQQAQVAAALGVGREFAVHLEALLAQPLAGPAEFDADVLLVQAQQRGGHGQGFGLDLGVPQHGPGGLGEPLERTGQQPPAGRRQQPGRGAPAGSTPGAQRGVEEFLAAVGVPPRPRYGGRRPAPGAARRRSGRSAAGRPRRAGVKAAVVSIPAARGPSAHSRA